MKDQHGADGHVYAGQCTLMESDAKSWIRLPWNKGSQVQILSARPYSSRSGSVSRNADRPCGISVPCSGETGETILLRSSRSRTGTGEPELIPLRTSRA